MLVCVCACVCVFARARARARVCVCMCMCAHALGIVPMDKILRFTNTLIIIIYVLVTL